MTTLITDPWLERRIRQDRCNRGIDGHDEIWDGVYVVMPPADVEHQDVLTGLLVVLEFGVGQTGLGQVYPGVNVSDQEIDWERNVRCPDIAVVMRDSSARDCDTHYFGGPDFLVEIVTPFDMTRDKLPFYGKVGVRELLLIDRNPWALELYKLQDGTLATVSQSTVKEPALLASGVLPLSFRLLAGESRPRIEVIHRDGAQHWIV